MLLVNWLNMSSLLVYLLPFFIFRFRLVSIAEETLTEFLSKATGTAVEWIQMPGMKVNINHKVISNFRGRGNFIE